MLALISEWYEVDILQFANHILDWVLQFVVEFGQRFPNCVWVGLRSIVLVKSLRDNNDSSPS